VNLEGVTEYNKIKKELNNEGSNIKLSRKKVEDVMLKRRFEVKRIYTLSEAWSGVNWADLMAAQGAFGTDFYDRSTLRPKHHAYYRSDRPVIKIGPKGALGSHEICPIHSAPSLGQSICLLDGLISRLDFYLNNK